MIPKDPLRTQALEIELLLKAVRREKGYDFQNYARHSLDRRIEATRIKLGQPHISSLIPLLLHDDHCFDLFLREMSITVTEMFRNPEVYALIRSRVIPLFSPWPYVKIWCAGCATGEEAYSLAILLKEEGVYDRCQIYATDINAHSLAKACQASYPLEKMQTFVKNYHNSGGKKEFTRYYRARYESVIIDNDLRERILFSHHNLVCDGSFGEMNLILCRNVLIYFNPELQNRVLTLFDQSLCHGGILCLGDKETLHFSGMEDRYEPLSAPHRIYRKAYPRST